MVNESPTDKLIRELREENARLQELLKKGGISGDAAALLGDSMHHEGELSACSKNPSTVHYK